MVLSRRGAVALGLTVFLAVRRAEAAYPDRFIKMILPFPAGSTTDGIARFIADKLRLNLNRPIVIDNQAGADGILATQAAKRATPDGYTLLISTNSAHGVNSSLYSQLPYDPEKDFEPIGGLLRIPLILCVRKDFPANDFNEFIAVAKERSKTKPLSYGSGNTSSRVAAEALKISGKVDLMHVPYRGVPQALQDLIGGQIDALFTDYFVASAFIKSGDLKVFAVTDNKRLALLPGVPTLPELGHKDLVLVSFVAAFAPAGTPAAIIEVLNKAINDVLATHEAKDYIYGMGATTMPMTPEELRSFVRSEIQHWGELIEIAKIPKR